MTDRLRQSPPGAVHASRLEPITWAGAWRTLVVATAIGVFMSFVGAFGSESIPFLPRTAFIVAIALAGAAMGMLSFRLAALIPLARRGLPYQVVLGALLMTPPMTLMTWSITRLGVHDAAQLRELPQYALITGIMCLVMSAIAVFLSHRRAAPAVAPDPAPVKFLGRLPLKLRGAEVWAVEAEDHYLRLHTSKGQDLILMRLADAVAELEGVEGAQVHRSWWVARDAVADARRGDGRATLKLKDGSDVPVSRTYAKLIRDAGWI